MILFFTSSKVIKSDLIVDRIHVGYHFRSTPRLKGSLI